MTKNFQLIFFFQKFRKNKSLISGKIGHHLNQKKEIKII